MEAAASYERAHEKIKLYQYDCVLLDLTLPDGNGLDVVRTLKADRSPAGVFIVSAWGALDDTVLSLGLRDMRFSYGAGARIAWSLSTMLYADYGVSKEDRLFYFGIGQNF